MAKLPVDPWFCRLLRCCALLAPIALGGAAAMAQSPPYGAPPVAAPCYGAQAYTPAPPPAQPIVAAQPAEDLVVQVQIQGNRAVSIEKILAEVHTRQGRPYDPEMIQEDVVRLQKLRTFVRVQSFSQRVPGGRIVIFRLIERPILQEVHIVGCVDYKEKALKKEIGFKAGDAADPFEVQAGRTRLEDFYHKKGYNKVRVAIVEGNKPGQLRAIYTINEGPKTRIWWVNVVGPTVVGPDHIKWTVPKTKPPLFYLFGGEADFKEIDEDVNRITAFYRGLGYFQARVGRELEFNADQSWLTVTFVVDEGVRSHIRKIGVAGNTKFATPELMEKLNLTAGKDFNQAEMNADVVKLQRKYGSIGYVFADVKGDLRYLDRPGEVDLVYNIHEGHPYRVDRVLVEIKGENPHTRITTVLQRLSLQPGDIADIREIADSERRIKFSSLFVADPSKGDPPKLVMLPEDGAGGGEGDDKEDKTEVADRKHRSGGGYRGQSPDPPGQAETTAESAGGDRPLDIIYRFNSWEDLRRAERELGVASPAGQPQGQPAQAAPTPSYGTPLPPPSAGPSWQPPAGDLPTVIRGQAPGDGGFSRPDIAPPEAPLPQPAYQPAPQQYSQPQYQYPPQQYANPQPQHQNPQQYAAPQPYGTPPPPQPAYGPATAQPAPMSSSGVTPGAWPAGGTGQEQVPAPAPMPPGNQPMAPYAQPCPQPAPQFYPQPVSPPGYVQPPEPIFGPGRIPGEPPSTGEPLRDLNLLFKGEESQTGRIMLGVGVNSDAGLVGNIVLEEHNFDWSRWPSSWEDIRNGTAWRGAGEYFRIEAMPGTEYQSYGVNFTEPYWTDLEGRAVSLTLSGQYYERIFTEWQEQREGGRVGLGYQLTHDLTASVAFRAFNVNISNPVVPTPEALTEVLGNNGLYGFQVGLAHDTRDNQFLATEGHHIGVTFEEVIGTWVYPHVEMEFTQNFKLSERADGTGRHVLIFSNRAGFSGDDTPIYERYFAGGYSSLRGFEFHGVSPVDPATQQQIGGDFQLLNSVEYMFPITADDMLRGVFFVDGGTVEPMYNQWTDKYRVAVGFGLRISLPMMGPAPIALDFGFPIVKEPTDLTQVFSFFVGFNH